MAYQINYNKKGFTLVEVIVVITIFSIFAAISISSYTNLKSNSALLISTYDIVDTFRHAQTNAQKSKENSVWGVKVFTDKLILFKGNTYNSRDTDFDQTINFSKQVQVTVPGEIVFDKITGWTTDTGTTTVTGGEGTKYIHINEKGTITY